MKKTSRKRATSISRKPITLFKLKRKVQTAFNRYIILRDKCCQRCGKTCRLECSHVKSVGAYPNLRFDEQNAIALCYRCHRLFWHLEPTESYQWLEGIYPDRVEYLEKQKNIPRKYPRDELKDMLKFYIDRIK